MRGLDLGESILSKTNGPSQDPGRGGFPSHSEKTVLGDARFSDRRLTRVWYLGSRVDAPIRRFGRRSVFRPRNRRRIVCFGYGVAWVQIKPLAGDVWRLQEASGRIRQSGLQSAGRIQFSMVGYS